MAYAISCPMFDQDLKKAWVGAAHRKCEQKHKLLTPSKGVFSNYLGRLFRRESLSNINADNFMDHIQEIRAQIGLDIKANKPSTGRVAGYLSLALEEAIKESGSVKTLTRKLECQSVPAPR